MNLVWLAAALNPRDVAPHPNFMSSERVTFAGLFALLMAMRIRDFEQLTRPDEGAGGSTAEMWETDRGEEMLVVHAARASLLASSALEGAQTLADLAPNINLDEACGVASALMASVAYAELDRHEEAAAALERMLARIGAPESADERLLRAALLQQLALRRLEIGEGGAEESTEVLRLLDNARQRDFSSFPVSKGVGWRSSRTIGMIVEELRSTADAHLENLKGDLSSREWVRFVRSPAPELVLRSSHRAESGFTKYVAEQFESRLPSAGRTFFSGDPVESPIYEALLHYELVGAAPQARAWRTRLGMLRVLRPHEGGEVWPRRDGLRLLRQANDPKSVNLVVRDTRAGGPLDALVEDARQIIVHRLDPRRLGAPELLVLRGGAHLLSRDEASLALTAVQTAVASGVPAPSGRWEAVSVRLERGWMAAVELAGPAERLDEVALALLDAARKRPSDDVLLERALTRAAMNIEWEGVTEATRHTWASWIGGSEGTAGEMAEAVGPLIGIEPPVGRPSKPSLERAASVLNRYFRTGALPDEDELAELADHIVADLRRIRDEAGRGSFSFGAISTGDVAAASALHMGLSVLWEPLADLLLDPRVNREDKAAALERLASANDPLPAVFLRHLGEGSEALLSSRAIDPLITHQVVPFPAALRFLAAHSVLPDERVLALTSRLSGSGLVAERTEAARTLSLLARLGQDSDWVVVMGLQLSHDADALVRAEGGRCLALVARNSERHAGVVEQRLLELLGHDGLLAPLLVLRGLEAEGATMELSPPVRRLVSQLAISHPARGVRLQARTLLDQGLRQR